ncbi:MAG TPA: sugar phosphate isomerase/epimerase [Candidatus Lokiarchaeia archaeon]|nr:sugar phosphate isomerase/epimerase [Candidatus Lokiarchaeia archaeon]
MKPGISSMFFGDMSMDEFFGFIQGHGEIQLVDIWYDTPFHLLEDDSKKDAVVAAVKNYANDLGLDVVAHAAAFDVNPIAYSPAVQLLTLEETEKSLIFASNIGARFVTVHGGFSSFGTRVTRYDLVLFERFLDELEEFIGKQELDITLCLENDAATPAMMRPLESLHHLQGLLDKHENINVTLDIAHIIKSSLSNETFIVREPRIDRDTISSFLEVYGERVKIVHASCPNKYRTHGRIDFSGNDVFMDIKRKIDGAIDSSKLDCIFEYAMEEFSSPADAMDSLIADMASLEEHLEGA